MGQYAKYRNIALDRLIAAGFNKPVPTRLGADILVLKSNYDEIMDIYEFCRDSNIHPLVVTFIPCGMTVNKYERDHFDVPATEKTALWKQIYEYNIRHSVPFDDIAPYAGGHVCTQLQYAFYVNVRGLVYRCPGERDNIGSLVGPGASTLRELWNEYGGNGNSAMCPPRYRCGSLPKNLRGSVSAYIENIQTRIKT